MSAVTVDYGRYKDKMVDLTLRGEGEDSTQVVQGRVIEGNELGVIFKRRSQRVTALIEADLIVGIEEAASTARLQLIGKKGLRPVVPATVRRHLADYHGYPVSKLNEMSNEAAMSLHDTLDHEDLGHDHSASDEGKAERSRSESESSADSILGRIRDLQRSA